METSTAKNARPIHPSKDATSLPTNTVSTKASIHKASGTPEASAQNSASKPAIVMTQNADSEFKADL